MVMCVSVRNSSRTQMSRTCISRSMRAWGWRNITTLSLRITMICVPYLPSNSTELELQVAKADNLKMYQAELIHHVRARVHVYQRCADNGSERHYDFDPSFEDSIPVWCNGGVLQEIGAGGIIPCCAC
jgi:hypothetical protein